MLGMVALVLVVTTGITLGGFFGVRAGYRWLRSRVERRQRLELIANAYQRPALEEPSLVAPVWVAFGQLALLALLLGPETRSTWWAVGAGLASTPILVYAFALHGLPRHRRNAKYVALWIGAFLLQIGVGPLEKDNPTFQQGWVYAIMPISLLVGTAIARSEQRRHDAAGPTRPLAFTFHQLCMVLGPAPGLRAFVTWWALRSAGLFPGYLMLRYFVRPYVTRQPFLYLRSFHDDSAQTFLARVLAPSAGSQGVVVGLIHETQTGEILNRKTDQAWQAEVFALPDSAWQTWVLAQLDACMGVIIDLSIETSSVSWELQQALARLPPERILVVSRTVLPPEVAAANVRTIQYSLASRIRQLSARRALLEWANGAVHRALHTDSPPPARASARGLRWFAYAGIALWTTLAVAIVTELVTLIGRGFAGEVSQRHVVAALERWGERQHVAEMIAAVLFAASASLFVLEGVRSRAASRAWVYAPCAALALTSLLLTRMPPGSASALVDALGSLAAFMLVGYVLVACLDAHMRRRATFDLERTILALLAPIALQLLFVVLVIPIAAAARSTAPLWVGWLGVICADVVAAAALVALISRATTLRTASFEANHVVG